MLDYEATLRAFDLLTKEINENNKIHPYTVDEVAYGFVRVANEAMARPIRNLTTMKGYDVTKHALSCFGGAGPQHCCAIAKSLGMKKVYVHRLAASPHVLCFILLSIRTDRMMLTNLDILGFSQHLVCLWRMSS